MRCSRDNPVDPGLLVLVAGSCEGGSGELFGVEAVRGFLGGVLRYRESTFDGF